MIPHIVKDDVFAGAGGEIIDGLEDLVRDTVQFEGGMKRDDGVAAQGVGHAVPVERNTDEGPRVNSVGNQTHTALPFEAVKLV